MLVHHQWQEISCFLESLEEDNDICEVTSDTFKPLNRKLARRSVKEPKSKVPVDLADIITGFPVSRTDPEKLMFQVMRYSDEFTNFVMQNTATTDHWQFLCNYIMWYANEIAQTENQQVQSIGVKRKHASVSEPQLVEYDSVAISDIGLNYGPQRDSSSLSNTSISTLSETMTASLVSSSSSSILSTSSKFSMRDWKHFQHWRAIRNDSSSYND